MYRGGVNRSTHPWIRPLAGLLRWLLLIVALPLALGASSAQAQAQAAPRAAAAAEGTSTPEGAGAADPAAELPAAPDSPRASVREFFSLCRAHNEVEAARFLDLADPKSPEGPLLAKRLKAVLDRQVWVDLDLISPNPLGDTTDKLPGGVDEIAKVPGPAGKLEPVRITRRLTPEGIRWVFTRSTVDRINPWYSQLNDRWFLDHFPEVLLRPGPKELLLWQWLALPVLVLVAWMLSRGLTWITRYFLGRIVARTAGTWDDQLVESLRKPIIGAWTLCGIYAALPWMGLYEPADAFLTKGLKACFFLVLFWSLLRIIEVVGSFLLNLGRDKELPGTRSLVPLLSSLGKVLVLVMGLVAVLSELGYPVASLLAGFGIGGIIIALAAQKTVENLFGSVSIGLDKPFGVGDFVKVDDITGTIEKIGLRSTRIRTLDRTLVTIPNGRLADMRVESFSHRDRMRLHCHLGLVYGTTAAQIREITAGIEELVRAHASAWPEDILVRFKALGASSLDIEVMAWFTVSSVEFPALREEMLLGFMEIVERAGSGFAFPTQTLHIVSPSPSPSPEPASKPG